MSSLLLIGVVGVSLMSVAALLASIGDWRIARSHATIPAAVTRRKAAVTVVIYYTDMTATLMSIASLQAVSSRRLTIIVVDNAILGSHAHAFRLGLRRLYRQPVRLIARRKRTTRREALLAAYRHITPRQQVIIIDGGDLLTDEILATLPQLSAHQLHGSGLFWHRQTPLGPSFSETAEALAYSARQFSIRTWHAIAPRRSAQLPAGTTFADRQSLRRTTLLRPLGSVPLSTVASALPHTLIGRAALVLATLSGLAIFGHTAYLAASFQTAQPLLLTGLLSLYGVSILILWDQTTRLVDKLKLLSAAPLSALLVPVSLLCMTCVSITRSIRWPHLRLWQLLPWARRKHS